MYGLFVLLSVWMVVLQAHPYYRDQIPNGYSVPNPCGAGIWEAVGHYDPHHHTILKNPFAQAFAANGHVWSEALCRMDSDGDGKTNGQELGDPNCIWHFGGIASNVATGHPGICNPVGSCNDGFHCGCHGHTCVGK